MRHLKILLVDDHAVVRSGLRRLLENSNGIEVVAEAATGEIAYQLYGEVNPDIVVMDISMPGMGGIESAKRILQRYSHAKIIIFSMHEAVSFASQALKTGVKGFVTKTGMAEDLLQAVIDVSRGKTFLSAGVAKKIAMQTLTGDTDPIHQLTSREFEVFRLLVEGKRVEEVADMLKLSQKTVANYYTLIKQKLGVSSPIEMVRLAMKHGLIVDS
ncbi:MULTISPECIES: response regulator transcription factor [unclassified Methylotenera]|jgi:DNA-binding NarL/FixJ family response regulator|uniref:response regulator n=1 Tax=unclassified Methylotenera TaxID=2643294 RepID=UPI0003740AE6|nr:MULTISPECIES: response regulator transcription factor [unclassified Methylotenera]